MTGTDHRQRLMHSGQGLGMNVAWDLPDSYGRTNGVLDNHPTNHDLHSSEQTLIADAVAATDADIRIFLVSSEGGLSSAGDAYGMTCRAQATCWVLGSRVLENRTGEFVMHTIAHEIGHVFVGYGHPDQRIQQGPAPLPGTRHSDRLMCSGRNITSKSRILVKGEWDEAEKWLDRTIKESN